MKGLSRLAGFALLVLATTAGTWVQAQQKLVPAQSEIVFISKQMGSPVDGHFKKFDAQVNFDAAKPENSSIKLSIDMTSATIGVPETDAEMPKATWFNVAKFPQATFESTSVKAQGAGKYVVQGKINIKGVSQDVTVPVSMTQAGANTVATGALPIKRLAFKIGQDEWADTSMVADEVQVKFKFTLTGVGKI